MLRQACRFFSGFELGCVEMTANTKKLIYQKSGSREYVWKNVSGPEVTDTEMVIPDSHKYMIQFTTSEPTDQVRHAPASTYTGYDEYGRVVARMHYFLGRLGWDHIDMGGGTWAAPWSVLAGNCESGRSGKLVTSYRFGNLIRGQHRILTNLPIAPTHPIDAGIVRFCESCKTCASECPYEAMDMGERSWEHWHEPTNRMGAFITGTKGWRTAVMLCPKCKGCQATCPFNSADDAILHSIVRNVSGVTSIFNSFFADMHDTFGFGTRNPEEWWEHDVPVGLYNPSFTKP
jgi:reductive dehalogenase